jgi:hypothetical protein
VKQKKETRKVSEGQYKDRSNNLKNKAIIRGAENNCLKKRIKELTKSRDIWKNKYQALSEQPAKSLFSSIEKAKHHQYNLMFVVLLLELQKYGSMSLRSCRHCLGCLLISLGLTARLPSHNSVRNWLCKAGFHRLSVHETTTGHYVLYVDESIVFGSEKILLILGVMEDKIPPDRSLQHSDMEVLYVGASVEWKGEDIEAQLLKISETKRIKYVVSDNGNNLRKAYKALNYSHIEDCTHVLANYLKALYEKEEDFESFRKLIGKLRQSWTLSKENSIHMPPTMRGKMRFANIFPCVAWAKKHLENWSNLSSEVQEALAFLKEKRVFINSLIQVSEVFKMLCAKLKNEGFGVTQKQSIFEAFDRRKNNKELTQKASIFIEKSKAYLDNLTAKSQALSEEHLLCSSDIIESYFGKFKTKINANNPTGLTEFIFTIANFSQPFSVEEVKNALENVKLKDLKLVKKQPKTNDNKT